MYSASALPQHGEIVAVRLLEVAGKAPNKNMEPRHVDEGFLLFYVIQTSLCGANLNNSRLKGYPDGTSTSFSSCNRSGSRV